MVGWRWFLGSLTLTAPGIMGGWRCIYSVYSGNMHRKGAWGAELCLETVEHLLKPQGRLHWERYDLILFQQSSRPGPGRDELLKISRTGVYICLPGYRGGDTPARRLLQKFLGIALRPRSFWETADQGFSSLGPNRNEAGERELGPGL